MISVKVLAILDVAKVLNGREQMLYLPEKSTVMDLLKLLELTYGEPVSKTLYDENGEIRPELNLLLNGRNIIFLKDIDTELEDNDEFLLMPPVGGG